MRTPKYLSGVDHFVRSMIILVFLLAEGFGLLAQAVTDSTKQGESKKGKLTIEGYVDVYYSYAVSHPKDGYRPYFVSYNRDNEVNVNLAYIGVNWNGDRVRATFKPGFGTYMNANYASERQSLQYLLEANVGVSLFKNRDIWLDAGVMQSPYTYENAYSFDQISYTRSLGSENTPYYQTGAKLSLPINGSLTAYLYLLNGWQTIQAQHSPLDFASQLEFKPNSQWDINWNTYIGNESSTAHPEYKTRFFTDIYPSFSPSDRWTWSADAYVGWQQVEQNGGQSTKPWWNANLAARYNFSKSSSLSARIEYFDDSYQILVTPVTGIDGFKLSSASLGYNLSVTGEVYMRLEARYFLSPLNIYPLRDGTNTSQDFWFTAGLTARFR